MFECNPSHLEHSLLWHAYCHHRSPPLAGKQTALHDQSLEAMHAGRAQAAPTPHYSNLRG